MIESSYRERQRMGCSGMSLGLRVGLVGAAVAAGLLGQSPGTRPTPRPQAQTQPAKAASKKPLPTPATVAERSGYKKTSLYADVMAFLDELGRTRGVPIHRAILGKTSEGKDIPIVFVGADGATVAREAKEPATDQIRVLINADIHAGEVEGKEAALMLLRELHQGRHAMLLQHLRIMVVPIFNADGNDKISKQHRVSQNGPDGGVGTRQQAEGYDLNRDFVKLDTPECRALVKAFQDYDPQVFVDLHTTNGSYHGYHLTYSPSLATNVAPEIREFVRDSFLPELRSSMTGEYGFRTFDYGNFKRGPARGWITYDHRPRFGTNYFGLRNRIAVLSETYSYLPFEQRVKVTRGFALQVLYLTARTFNMIRDLCAEADTTAVEHPPAFGYASVLEDPHEDEVLVGSVSEQKIEGLGTRRIASSESHATKMPVQVAFVAKEFVAAPRAWVIVKPSDAVVARLRMHGIRFKTLTAPTEVSCQVFHGTVKRSARPFQKHHEVTLEGAWKPAKRTLPAGAIWVPAKQRLARLAAQLLEAQSEDSLSTWNFFDDAYDAGKKETEYPVLRVVGH